MYSKPVGDIIQKHGLTYHCYADDTQVYITFKPSSEAWKKAISKIELCVQDIKDWMTINLLKLNDSKTELIVFAPKHLRQHCQNMNIKIEDINVEPAPHVRNLGVVFDQTLSMEKHVNSVSRTCHYHMRNIGRIRRYLTDDACRTVVQSLVTSRLDYANVLLHGLPNTIISRLQRVQNTAARIIARIPRCEHITPVLKQLHWLPVEKRLQYKVLLHTYKALNGTSPSYIINLIEHYQPARSLRSQNRSQLKIPATRSVTFGDRSFVKAAPQLWNGLPKEITDSGSILTFKRLLKTHLFRRAFVSI